MKRVLFIIISTAWLLTLCGCGKAYERIMTQAINYGEQHEELLTSCAQELCEVIAEKEDLSEPALVLAYRIDQKNGTMKLKDQINDTTTEFQSDLCQEIMEGGIIQYITVHYHDEHFNVLFSCGGSGFGPNTNYYDLDYVPTGKLQDQWWYMKNIKYEETDNGFYGKETNGDNSFFFHKISEKLYYCEASF